MVDSCDFDGDTDYDGADGDALQDNIVNGPANPMLFDLTVDGQDFLLWNSNKLLSSDSSTLATLDRSLGFYDLRDRVKPVQKYGR